MGWLSYTSGNQDSGTNQAPTGTVTDKGKIAKEIAKGSGLTFHI